jgi:arsenate reductase
MTLETTPPTSAAPGLPPPIRVIFISTGDAARSKMAQAILRQEGGARFEVDSAGVTPRGVDPLAIAALGRVGIDIAGEASRPVGAFLGRRFDYVITLCDRARATCPLFPGGRETLHWGLDDPAEATGTEAERSAAFVRVLTEVSGRIRRFIPVALAQVTR